MTIQKERTMGQDKKVVVSSKRKMVKKVKKVKKSKNVSNKSCSQSFPFQLMELMENEEWQDAIYWLEEGTAIGINTTRFVETILQPFFKGAKMESFLRRLKNRGFRKLYDATAPPDRLSYRHEMFQKGRRDLLPLVRVVEEDTESTPNMRRREFLPLIVKKNSTPPTKLKCLEEKNGKNLVEDSKKEIVQPVAVTSSEIQSGTREKQNPVQPSSCKSGSIAPEPQLEISDLMAAVRLRMLKREQELALRINTLQNESRERRLHATLEPILQDLLVQLRQQVLQRIQYEQQQARRMVILPPTNIRYLMALPSAT